GSKENLALSVRRYPMDFTLIASSNIQIAMTVESNRPDVFLFRFVKNFGLRVARDAVDLAVGRRRRIHAILGINCDSVNLECIEVGEKFSFAVGRNAVELGARSAGINICLGVPGQSPQVEWGGMEQFA